MDITQLLEFSVQQGASDLHLSTGQPPIIRIDGDVQRIEVPYGLLDYDGPDHAVPNKIGALKHRELGTYPGSLGRYAGEYLNIPVLTLELRSAGSMPSPKEIFTMWRDVEKWTMTKVQKLEKETIQQAYKDEKTPAIKSTNNVKRQRYYTFLLLS